MRATEYYKCCTANTKLSFKHKHEILIGHNGEVNEKKVILKESSSRSEFL